MDGGEAPRRSRRVEREEKKRDKKRKRAQEKAESIGAELDWAAGESRGGAGGASDGAAAGAAGASLGDAGGVSDGAAGGESSDEPFDNVGAVEMPEREEHDPQDADLRQYRQAVVKAYANIKGMPPFLEQDAGNNIEFFAAPLPGWNDSRKELDWDHLHVAGCARVRVCDGGEAQSEFVLFCDCCAEAQKVWHDVQIFHDTCGVQHSADCIHFYTHTHTHAQSLLHTLPSAATCVPAPHDDGIPRHRVPQAPSATRARAHTPAHSPKHQ